MGCPLFLKREISWALFLEAQYSEAALVAYLDPFFEGVTKSLGLFVWIYESKNEVNWGQ